MVKLQLLRSLNMRTLTRTLVILVGVALITGPAMVGARGSEAAAAVSIYTDRPTWEGAVPTYAEEFFTDAILNAGLSVVSDNGYVDTVKGVWWDRLEVANPRTTTTWSFTQAVNGYGANWDANIPGGPGSRIQLLLDGIPVGQEIPNTIQWGFWGVTSTTPFNQVRLEAGTDPSGWCETYEMDNMVYGSTGAACPVKWSQKPDMGYSGVDIRAEHPCPPGGQIVADDWMCTDPRPVVGIRWWGSYLDPNLAPQSGATRMLPFELSFHTGDSQPPPQSAPGMNPQMYFGYATETFFGIDGAGNRVYEYYIGDPNCEEIIFRQKEGEIYWLDVELDIGRLADVDPNWHYGSWGWHTTDEPWRDTAAIVLAGGNHNGPWVKIDHDMAFQIIVPEPASACLLAMGALAALRRRRTRK